MAATFKNKFAALGIDLKAAIDEGLGEGAGLVADLASQLAPYDPTNNGAHLNESIEAQRGSDGQWRVVAGVGLPDIRADVQEHGSIYQEAQPYLAPAAKEIDIEQVIADAIRRRLA